MINLLPDLKQVYKTVYLVIAFKIELSRLQCILNPGCPFCAVISE